ncbi:MAG: hypothetical protein V4592_06090 [Bacteroidota bacterium]
MKLYRSLSGIKLLSNYTVKFMFVSFLGIHIPLFGIIGLLIYSSGSSINKASCFLLTLGLTLLSTTVTLLVLNGLVVPLKKAQRSLSDYIDKKSLPNLPDDMTDEMGILMRDINTVVATLHTNLGEKDQVIQALSHNLREPATRIQTIIKSIKAEQDPAATTKYLNDIDEAITSQLSLMDEIVRKYGD